MLLYHGETLFERWTGDPQSLAKTVLGVNDILHVWWTHIYFENVAHCKIQFAISL